VREAEIRENLAALIATLKVTSGGGGDWVLPPMWRGWTVSKGPARRSPDAARIANGWGFDAEDGVGGRENGYRKDSHRAGLKPTKRPTPGDHKVLYCAGSQGRRATGCPDGPARRQHHFRLVQLGEGDQRDFQPLFIPERVAMPRSQNK